MTHDDDNTWGRNGTLSIKSKGVGCLVVVVVVLMMMVSLVWLWVGGSVGVKGINRSSWIWKGGLMDGMELAG